MKGYVFTGHHEKDDIEKATGYEMIKSFPSAAEALQMPSGNKLWLVKMKGIFYKSPYTGEAEGKKVKYLKCFGDKTGAIKILAYRISEDIKHLWNKYPDEVTAIRNSDEERYDNERSISQNASRVFHSAISSRIARKCESIKDLAGVVCHAISAWESVSINKKYEAVERYSGWIEEA